MRTYTGRFRPLFLLLAMLAACDESTAPGTPGVLQISTNTTGLDMTAYVVTVDGQPPRALAPNDSLTLQGMTGHHTVLLSGLAGNCTLTGPNPLIVDVADNSTSAARFIVACVAKTGVVEITTTTLGLDAPAQYQLAMDDQGQFVSATSTRSIVGVAGGTHVVQLAGTPSNCSVAGGAARSVSVAVGGTTRDTARVDFNVTCTSIAGVIEITFNASSVDFGNTFAVSIDDGAPRPLLPNTKTRVVTAVGAYALRLQAPANCSIVGPGETTVTVAASSVARDTARTTFQANCTIADLIAFNRDNEVVLVQPDGSNTARVTDGYEPSWAPDGRRLVLTRTFCDYYCYDLGLSVADVRSGATTVTSLTTQADYGAAWSPNGASIAFIRFQKLFQIRPDGSEFLPILLPTGYLATSRVSWSPDGVRLAFGCREGSEQFDDICVVKLDGTGFARLTSEGRQNHQPAWSPDGSAIAFVRIDFQTQRDTLPGPWVSLMNADGSGMTRVVRGSEPAWSRDGQTIVFRNAAVPGLATVNRDGTGLVRLTTQQGDNAPAWRP